MHFTYCPHCGSLLGERILGDEGGVPWCETCNIPLFDVFSTCVICAVINRGEKAAKYALNFSREGFGRVRGKIDAQSAVIIDL